MKSLNLKLAISLVIGLVTVTLGVWFVHKFQVQKRSIRSYAASKEQYAEKNYKDAVNSVRRYRYYNPKDKEAMQFQIKILAEQFAIRKKNLTTTAARMELVDAYRELGSAYDEYFLKYEGTSDDETMHKDYLDLVLTPGLYNVTVANQEVRQLTRLKYSSPEFTFQKGQLLAVGNDLSAAAAEFAEIVGYDIEANKFNPEVSAKVKKIDAYAQLAYCLGQIKKGTDQDFDVIKEMQTRHPDHARAQYFAYRFLVSRSNSIEDARKAINTAYLLDRDDPEIQLAMFDRFMKDGESKKAEEVANDIRKSSSADPRRFMLQAQSLSGQGKISEALKVLDEGLAAQKDDPMILDAKIALQLASLGKSKDAPNDLKEIRKTWETYRDVVMKTASGHMGKMKMYEAKLAFLDGKTKEAIELAKGAKDLLPDASESLKADLFIGNCYMRLLQLEDARKVFEQIESRMGEIRDMQAFLETKVSLAKIYFNTNKKREAIAKLEQVLATIGPDRLFYVRDVWKPLFVAWISEEAAKPVEKRDWKKVDKFLDLALKQTDEIVTPDEKAMLQADIFMNKGDLDKALEQAVQLRTKDPNQVTAWVLWAQLMDRKNQPEEVIKGLDSAPESVKAHPYITRLKVGTFQKIGGEKAVSALNQLIDDSKKNTPKEQINTLIIVGESRLKANNIDEAKANFRAAQKLTEQYKISDLRPYDYLLAIARESGNVAEMQVLVKEIGTLKNIPEVIYSITNAQKLLMQIRESVRKRFKENQTSIELNEEEKNWLKEVTALLDKIQAARPDWQEAFVMRSDVAAFQNNMADQISYLRAAFEKGELNQRRARQLAELMQATGNSAEASRVLETMNGRTPDDAGMLKLKVSNLLSLGKVDEAKPLVESIKLDLEKASPEDIFWFAIANRGVKNFDKAIELARLIISKDSELKYTNAWTMLVATYIDKGDKEGAKAAIQELFSRPPSEIRELLAAACAEVMSDYPLAISYYDQAVIGYPESLRIRRQVVEFNIRNGLVDPARRAADDLAIVLQKKKDDPLAKDTAAFLIRAKAIIIAKGNPSYESFLEADKLLADAGKEGGKSSIPELTLRVSLLADRSEPESIRKAIDLMEQLRSLNQDLPVAQQVTLADLHQRSGNWPKAKEIMDSLLVKTKDDPMVGIRYAEMLVQNSEELTAKRMLEKYLVVLPDQKEKLATLRATILIKLRETEAGFRAISDWVGAGPYKQEDFEKLQKAAELLDSLNQTSEARKYFLELSKINSGGKGLYARFVGRRDDMAQGLALLEETARDKRYVPLCIQCAAKVILFNKNKLTASNQPIIEQYYQAIDRWLEVMQLSNMDPTQTGVLKAEVMELKGDLVQTVAIYRGLLQNPKLDPKFQAQLNNNLAYMIAIQNDTAAMPEAHQLVDNAIKTHGPDSDVLDTRGTLNLFEKKYELALQDFKDAVLVPTHLKYFHLALANFKLGYITPAREAMAKAQSLNFEPRDLNTEEHKLYEEMMKGLNPDQAAINAN